MNYKKAIGFGVLGWLIMFAAISAVLDWYIQFGWIKAATVPFAALVALVLAKQIKPADRKIALFYGVIWMAVGLVLDTAVTLRFNPEIFRDPYLWAGYAAVLLAPQFAVVKLGQAGL